MKFLGRGPSSRVRCSSPCSFLCPRSPGLWDRSRFPHSLPAPLPEADHGRGPWAPVSLPVRIQQLSDPSSRGPHSERTQPLQFTSRTMDRSSVSPPETPQPPQIGTGRKSLSLPRTRLVQRSEDIRRPCSPSDPTIYSDIGRGDRIQPGDRILKTFSYRDWPSPKKEN